MSWPDVELFMIHTSRLIKTPRVLSVSPGSWVVHWNVQLDKWSNCAVLTQEAATQRLSVSTWEQFCWSQEHSGHCARSAWRGGNASKLLPWISISEEAKTTFQFFSTCKMSCPHTDTLKRDKKMGSLQELPYCNSKNVQISFDNAGHMFSCDKDRTWHCCSWIGPGLPWCGYVCHWILCIMICYDILWDQPFRMCCSVLAAAMICSVTTVLVPSCWGPCSCTWSSVHPWRCPPVMQLWGVVLRVQGLAQLGEPSDGLTLWPIPDLPNLDANLNGNTVKVFLLDFFCLQPLPARVFGIVCPWKNSAV